MNPLLNEIAQRLTGRAGFDECTAEEFTRLAASYPAFSTPHILAALRQEESDPAYTVRCHRAMIYMASGPWSQTLLNKPQEESIHWSAAHNLASNLVEVAEPVKAQPEVPNTVEELNIPDITRHFQLPAETAPDEFESTGSDEDEAALPAEELSIQLPNAAETVAQLRSLDNKADKGLLPTDTLAFEPYHTVDYFASQGIRFRDEPQQKDKFSVQLRSFTDWLKTMKRLPATEAVAVSNAFEEKKVVQMAEVSIAPREVVTEAMAEVWEKQGDKQKAVRIYEKLSLLEPGKSAYFASKIEQLKQS